MNRRAADGPFAKVAVFLLTLLIGLYSWIGKNVYDSTVAIDRRLTVVESTLIDRTIVERLPVLEHRVGALEKAKPSK